MPLTIGDRYAGHYDLFENIFLNYHEQPPSYDVAADGRFVAGLSCCGPGMPRTESGLAGVALGWFLTGQSMACRLDSVS